MDVIVIGGSAAGLKAACRISRLQPDANVRVLVMEKYFAYSACGLPHFLSGDVNTIEALVSTPNGTIKDEKYFRNVKGIEILPRRKAISIDRSARLVQCKVIPDGKEETYPYDRLVIATGSKPVLPAIPGVDDPGVISFTQPDDAIKLRSELETGQICKVTIIGAGIVGLELCEAFSALWGVDINLIELQNQVLAGVLDEDLARMVEAEIKAQGINVQLGCGCREIVPESDGLCMFDNSGEMIASDRIVLASGVQPNSELARAAGLGVGITGGIEVNDKLQTSDPDIYAAGDCVELPNAIDGQVGINQSGSLASRMGRVVGDNICNGDSHFGPVVGAKVVKVFDITIGSVGLTKTECLEKGYEIGESWGTFHDRLHYYPEAGSINAKIIYDRSNSKLLGFQAVSRGWLVHTLNIAAHAIRTGATLEDLHEIEHSYAPPFALTFETLHSLAFIAENSRTAGVKLISPVGFNNLPEDTLILDVRIPSEIEGKPLNAGDHKMLVIPVEELRARLGEVPSNCPIVAVCQMGGRGWDAALMLRRAGFSDVGILAGGALFQPSVA